MNEVCIPKVDAVLDFLTFDKKTQLYTLEGYCLLCGVDNMVFDPYLIVNGKPVSCSIVKRIDESFVPHMEHTSMIIGFKAVLVLGETNIRIHPVLKFRDMIIECTNVSLGFYFPLSDKYQCSYAHLGYYTMMFNGTDLVLTKRRSWIKDIIQEFNFLCEIWKKNLARGKIGLAYRLFYHFASLFKYKDLWLISDRIERADDNGEVFFHFLSTNAPPKTAIVFAIKKDSKDYERLSTVGLCVNAGSIWHKALFLLCDVIISSQADQKLSSFYHYEELKDIYAHTKFVFLQHGVTFNDMSSYLNHYKQNISGFITSAMPESDSINSDNYGYSLKEVWLTGMPRFDRLFHDEKNYITIMPTWRKFLVNKLNKITGNWDLKGDFEKQEYYQFYDALINSDRLINALHAIGYTLQFFPHPNIGPYIDRFHHNPYVTFLSYYKVSYRNVFAESKLVITDYSSSVFDFVYLRKPLLYFHFDKERVLSGAHTYQKGYFDYERDGFGEVAYDLEKLIDLIIEYAKNGCVLKDIYRKRIDSFFAYNDQNNCRRVLDNILRM